MLSLRDVNNGDPPERERHFPFARVAYVLFFFIYVTVLFLVTDDYVPFVLVPLSKGLSSVPFFEARFNCTPKGNETEILSCYSDQLIARYPLVLHSSGLKW
jgi:hypothetical protein